MAPGPAMREHRGTLRPGSRHDAWRRTGHGRRAAGAHRCVDRLRGVPRRRPGHRRGVPAVDDDGLEGPAAAARARGHAGGGRDHPCARAHRAPRLVPPLRGRGPRDAGARLSDPNSGGDGTLSVRAKPDVLRRRRRHPRPGPSLRKHFLDRLRRRRLCWRFTCSSSPTRSHASAPPTARGTTSTARA